MSRPQTRQGHVHRCLDSRPKMWTISQMPSELSSLKELRTEMQMRSCVHLVSRNQIKLTITLPAQSEHCPRDQIPSSRTLKQSHSLKKAPKIEFKMFDHLLTGFDIQMTALCKQAPHLRKKSRVNQTGFPPDEKNSSDTFTVSAEGHWSDVGSMSWWEVIALWKRLVLSTPIPREKLLKRSVEPGGAEMSGHGHIAWTQIKLVLLQPSLIITASVCFGGGKNWSCCEDSQQWCARRWIEAGSSHENSFNVQKKKANLIPSIGAELSVFLLTGILSWYYVAVNYKILMQEDFPAARIFLQVSFPCRWNVWICCHPNWWAQSGMQLRHSCH